MLDLVGGVDATHAACGSGSPIIRHRWRRLSPTAGALLYNLAQLGEHVQLEELSCKFETTTHIVESDGIDPFLDSKTREGAVVRGRSDGLSRSQALSEQ